MTRIRVTKILLLCYLLATIVCLLLFSFLWTGDGVVSKKALDKQSIINLMERTHAAPAAIVLHPSPPNPTYNVDGQEPFSGLKPAFHFQSPSSSFQRNIPPLHEDNMNGIFDATDAKHDIQTHEHERQPLDDMLSRIKNLDVDDTKGSGKEDDAEGSGKEDALNFNMIKSLHDIRNLDSDAGKEWMQKLSLPFPWFMNESSSFKQNELGDIFPEEKRTQVQTTLEGLTLWPDEDPNSDRIINQLMFLPKERDQEKRRNKKIYLFYGRTGWAEKELPMGRDRFLADGCPVSTCELTTDAKDAAEADVVFFKVCIDLFVVSWTCLFVNSRMNEWLTRHGKTLGFCDRFWFSLDIPFLFFFSSHETKA